MADEGVVTSASSSAEKLVLFNLLFAMRSDVHAKSYFNKKTGRVGYTPACANEWKGGVCGKPRVKCADCANCEFLPLNDAALLAHFRGSGRDGVGVVAGYPLVDDDKTRVLAGRLRQGRLAAGGGRVPERVRAGGRARCHRALKVGQRRACVDVLQRAGGCVGCSKARVCLADARDAGRSERA